MGSCCCPAHSPQPTAHSDLTGLQKMHHLEITAKTLKEECSLVIVSLSPSLSPQVLSGDLCIVNTSLAHYSWVIAAVAAIISYWVSFPSPENHREDTYHLCQCCLCKKKLYKSFFSDQPHRSLQLCFSSNIPPNCPYKPRVAVEIRKQKRDWRASTEDKTCMQWALV